MIYIKNDNGIEFMKWIKTHEIINCDCCEKEYKKSVNSIINKCKKCDKNKDKNKDKKIKNNNLDPSNENEKYIISKIIENNKIIKKWVISEKRKICNKCCSLIWININNTIDINNNAKHEYLCQFCKPDTEDIKYKYDKKKQSWIISRMLKKCIQCNKNRWFNNSNNNNECFYCVKSNNMKLKKKINVI